ncbi:putative transcription regulator mTERF family [Rosa chinensis]|uniref:Putative transcription regulator mTERF family n=1 Tax=Rosa chinensis TaxID=74649 RepID=A0A2P6P346_ROSCH|nr:transcription termination factor MTERF15, mitochondrial [Rosa chinensis]PRQ16356.1 putative transcription regulator mTERF family [Rosa chinensis]
MGMRVLNRTLLTRFTFTSTPKQNPSLTNLKFQSFSSNPLNPRFSIQISNLLQRYGFPSSIVHNFISKNQYLLNSDLHDLDKSLVILSSFKIDQSSLVSLICDCPGVLDFEFLKKWELGFSKLGLLGASPLMIKSVLEQSKRFQIDPDGVFRSVEALRGLGFKDGTVCRVLEGFPGVVLMNEKEIDKRIEFLVGFGIPRDGIDRVLCCFPGVLGFGVEDRLKPLLCEFKDFGFGKDVIRREIVKEPRVLGMEFGEFSWCLEWLRTLKCREPIKEKIFSNGEFRAGFEVKLRVDCLCKHGLIRREAFEVLWKEPRSIIYKVEDIERKIEFLTHEMKFNIRCLVEVPEYLGVNFEKQIVPRFTVIEHLRSKGGLGCEVGLKGLIKPSRLRFYNLYVKPYPDCETIFGRLSGDGKVRNQHPAGLWKLFKPPSYPESKDDVKNTKSFMESLAH